MESPPGVSEPFASLDRRRDSLVEAGEWPHANQKLIQSLVEFELAKSGQSLGRTVSRQEGTRSRLQTALQGITRLDKPLDLLQLEDLLGLQRLLSANRCASFRQAPQTPLCTSHFPIRPSQIRPALRQLFEWVGSQSFAELHPLQQAALAQVRLYEIYPFETCGECSISIFSYYFLVAGSFLLPSPVVSEMPRFYRALEMAFGLDTHPLVELNLKNCWRSYELIAPVTG